MRYGSVCSGIEAATVAWHPLGWEPAFFSEIEAFPRAVLAHHYPDVPLHGDFTTIEADDYGPIDLLVGGTPCQSFSVAGLRGGLDDDRGNLSLEYIRLADRKRPRWVVWENVPGVFSSSAGEDFRAFLSGLVRWEVPIPAGGWKNSGVISPGPVDGAYGVAWRVLDAQYFGVPQRRRRVFVVGYIGDWRPAAAVLFERHSLSGHPAPRREAGEGVAVGALAGTSPGGGWRVGADEAAAGQLIPSTGDISHCLNAGGMGRQDYETETLIAHALRGEGFDASEDGTGRGTPLVPVAYGIRSDAMREGEAKTPSADAEGRVRLRNPGMGVYEETAPTLDASQPHAVAFNITPSNSNKDFNARESDRAQALTAGGNRPSARGGDLIAQPIAFTQNSRSEVRLNGGDGQQAGALGARSQFVPQQQTYVAAASAVRRLIPRECERLQGFPDDYTAIPYGKKLAGEAKEELARYFERTGQYMREVEPQKWVFDQEAFDRAWPRLAADGPRYKALGNSMAVPVMRWIGGRIVAVEQIITPERKVA